MNRLKEVRTQKGLSQFTLAKLADVSPSDISKVENEIVQPFPRWRQSLAKALGVAEAVLFPHEEVS